MATIKVSREHAHDKDEIRRRCDKFMTKMTELGLKADWQGDTCKFSGPAKGQLTLADKRVDLEVELGMALSLMKGKIEEKINEGLDRALK
jgi:putative polyhydroxyalkanoate system protein